jgi:hypothetical protein
MSPRVKSEEVPASASPGRLLAPHAELLLHHVRTATSGWSCGTFGAVAEFTRSAEEAVYLSEDERIGAVTYWGAIDVEPTPDMRPIAYETTTGNPDAWQHGLALCLPSGRCGMSGRGVLTEIGPDSGALRAQDRGMILFDIGLNLLQTDVFVRTDDPRLVERLRTNLGRPIFDASSTLIADVVKCSPHRVFCCRLGRIEVYSEIPTPGGRSPEGPHTHVLPKLLSRSRTHAASLPIPAEWVPCMTLFPANPMWDRSGRRKPFDRNEHATFQAIWGRYAEPDLVAMKAHVSAALRSGIEPRVPANRWERITAEVSRRQLKQLMAVDHDTDGKHSGREVNGS